MEQELPKVLNKYISKIAKEYFKAVKKHPKFARFWTPRNWTKAGIKDWMLTEQEANDGDEENDCQKVWSIFKEEDLEAMESVVSRDEKNARTELLQGIVVRLRALEKLDSEGL